MTSAREDILSGIRRRLRRGAADAQGAQARLRNPRRNIVPARADLPPAARLTLFETMAVEQAATVVRVPDMAAVPGAAAAFLRDHGLPARLRLAPALAALDWGGLEAAPGKAEPSDAASLTPAFAAVAETGTLVLLSGPTSPTSLNFLPDTHIVVVRAEDVVGCYEEAWERLRAEGGGLPRTINMITGPSRTGDIEQTIQLGAHGPRRLHVVLVGDGGDGA